MTTEEQSDVLAGRYRLGRIIGRGGMADVYRATDELLEREVAVKVLRARTAGGRDRARFETEARTVAQLDHPHLVSLLDAGIDDETPYLVMDLVEGRSLAAACADGPLPAAQVATVGAELADALGYVHDHEVVHRDLKPGNVLLGDDGRVRLADFGIARLLGDTAGNHTATGTLIGTAAYLAPEQVRGQPVSPASDVYSLGLLLLEALTGIRAYTGTPTEAALARLHTPPPIPETVPRGWVDLLRAMTDLDQTRRPAARDAGRALRALASAAPPARLPVVEPSPTAGFPIPDVTEDRGAAPSGPGVRRPRRRGRGRWLWAGLAVLAVVAVAGVAAMRLTMPDPSHATPVPPDVRAALRAPLQDLHEAVDGGGLTGGLDAVDDSVRGSRWRAARRDIDDLVRAAVRAQAAGEVSSAQAQRVEAAAARLAVVLPVPAPGLSGSEDG